MADTLQQAEGVEAELDGKDSSEFSTSILDDPRRDAFPRRDSFHEFFEKSLDDEGSELSFRVTTTNLPFEKCLDRWAATLEDQIMENMDEPSNFIFEDYMDRSNRVNIRRSSAPMCYDAKDEKEGSKIVAKLTKVRFVIESSNSSTPERGLDERDDTELPSIDDSLESEGADDWNRASSVRLTEITNKDANWTKVFGRGLQEDEFGDVPFSSVLRNSSGEWSFEDANEIFVETVGSSLGNEKDSSSNSAGFDSRSQVSSWPEEKLKITEFKDEFFEGRDSFNATKFDSRSQVCSWAEEKLKITEVGEEEGLKTERSSEKPAEKGGFADTASNNNVEDNKEYLINEHNLTNITGIIWETAATGTEDNSKSELIGNEINFVGKGSAVGEKEDSFAAAIEDKSLTINKTKVLDGATNEAGNNVLKNNLLSNVRESEEASSSSIEEDTNVDGCVKIIDPPDRSTLEYKRKIFVNETLRSMMNHYYFTSNDLQEESEDSDSFESNDIPSNEGNPQKERREAIIDGDKATDNPITRNDGKSQDYRNELPLDKKKSVPVDIRRNFFLENMLSEETDESWTSCRIIAAQPKSPAKEKEGRKVADRLNESIKMDLEIQKILQESKEVGETDLSKVVETGKKNASDVKCDVLNELLSNFNSIKLKPVSRVEKKRSADESGSERESRNDCNSPVVRRTSDEDIDSESTRKIPNNWKRDDELEKKQSQDDVNFPVPTESSVEPDRMDSRCLSTEQERYQACPARGTIPKSSSVETGVEPIEAGEISKDLGDEERIKSQYKSELDRRTREEEWTGRKSDGDVEGRTRDGKENGGGRLEEEAQTGGCSEKTDARDESYYNRGAIARQLNAISGEKKSAIARRNSRPHCNNNDNNRAVTTPVVLSDDQSRDVVTITPGRVRKFVKYYEIRHEVTTTDKDSKANDRLDGEVMLGHRSVYSIRRGLEARADTLNKKKKRRNDSPTGNQRRERSSSANSTRKESGMDENTGIIEKVGKRGDSSLATGEDRVVGDDLLIEDDQAEAKREEMVRVSSCTRAGKTKRKKSVKFQGGFTVIGAKSLEDNGPGGSPDGQKPVERRKIPDRPRQRGAALVDKVDFQDGQSEELADADSRSFEDRDIAAAQIQAAAKCEECSGINRFVSKPETPRLVFYCTV
ncbi:uncharacterized protein LOC102678971 [Apis dorsata]|uniref:uncharacterized protein LOC102678971 n=1 Tax=Apis dorsata TaxID=7462 RepID=UPI001292E07A|nr:uncharacterized protein LOC102678971 [Apis dorsata]